jgi:hypothetical protein
MKKHRLDSVFYIPRPAGNNEMLNLFTHHSLVTIDQVIEHVNMLQDVSSGLLYDDYDIDGLMESAAYLIDTIDAKLQSQIIPYYSKNVTEPELWMCIVRDVQSDSAECL